MAQRFIEQAQQQVAPIYDQQIRAAQAQIPEIQNLYNTLIGGLRGESERQLATGTQNILEDAARRGVLRSTLPVDTRTELQGAISSALTRGIGDLSLQQLENVRGLQGQIGQLQLGRQGAIQSLAESLQQADLREREFQRALELQRQQAAQRASLNQQSSAINALLAQLANQRNQVPTNQLPDLTALDSIFGARTAPQLRVQTQTPQTLLQPSGAARIQPTINLQRAAAPRTRVTQPRLQGANALRGTLRVR